MKKTAFALVVAGAALMAADGAALFKKCAVCHGLKAEKQALGKSGVITGWDAAKTEEVLNDYKAGTRNVYGMGALMKGQVAAYSAEDMKAVAVHIAGLK